MASDIRTIADLVGKRVTFGFPAMGLVDRVAKASLGPVRVHAPVGEQRHLLGYLVRQLLENGANSSFVNRFLDDQVPTANVV